MPTANAALKTLGITIAFASALILFLWLRVGGPAGALNPDETIAPALAQAMADRGDLNANWRLAPSLSEYFRYDQHNFYSYHLLSRAFLVPNDAHGTIAVLRLLNIVMQAAAIFLFAFALRKAKVGFTRIALVCLALIAAPVLVFDAHIARAESLLYLLLAAVCAVAASQLTLALRWGLAGIFIGLGTASKITFLATAIILLPEALRYLLEQRRLLLAALPSMLAGVVVGFGLGAPYSLLEPQVFLNGVRYLLEQYSTGHPPHSFEGATLLDHVLHLSWFATLLTGTVWLTLYVPAARGREWLLGLALMAVAILVYFATKPVFFERNIGLALAAGCVLAFAVPRHPIVRLALAASLVVMGFWSWQISAAIKSPGERVRQWEIARFGQPIANAWPFHNAATLLAECSGIVGVIDYGDPASRDMVDAIGEAPIAEFRGRFWPLPTSTLHTYLEASVRYYNCRGQVAEAREGGPMAFMNGR